MYNYYSKSGHHMDTMAKVLIGYPVTGSMWSMVIFIEVGSVNDQVREYCPPWKEYCLGWP